MQTNPLLTIAILSLPAFASNLGSIGPFGGSAAVIEIVPHHPGTVLAASSNALLFKSTDSGASWNQITFPAQLRATLHAFVVAPRTDIYWAAVANDTHEYSGLYRSADEGRTWTRSAGLEHHDVWSIGIFRADSNILAAGTSDGIFMTHDGGATWDRISPQSNLALMPVVSLAFDTADPRILYAGTPHLPWKTNDGGTTWEPAAAGMENDSDVFSMQVDGAHPGRIFASACSGIYRSLNGGESWTKLPGAGGASYRTYEIVEHPSKPDILFAGTAKGLVRSTNGGKTWRRLSGYLTRSIVFDPVRVNRIFIATEAGLFRSDDLGETFRPINNGFCNRPSLSVAAAGNTLYATSSAASLAGSIFRRAVSEVRWQNVMLDSHSAPEEPVVRIVPLDEAHLFAITPTSLLFSPDGGQTWRLKWLPPVGTRLTALLALKPDGQRLIVGAEDGIYYTNDAGETWERSVSPAQDSAIRSLVVTSRGWIVAITRSTVLLSTDAVAYSARTSPGASEIYGLVATDRDTLLAATANGLKRSVDYAASWQSADGILDGNTISAICKHPGHPGVLFASGFGAVFMSVDDGHTWARLNSEQEILPTIKELLIVPGSPERLFAVTHSQGIYDIPLELSVP